MLPTLQPSVPGNVWIPSESERNISDEELEVEENEVAIPIPAPGKLVPIEDVVQVLPNELVGTQIAFELADEDRPPLYK